jgi:hypothetical protein
MTVNGDSLTGPVPSEPSANNATNAANPVVTIIRRLRERTFTMWR